MHRQSGDIISKEEFNRYSQYIGHKGINSTDYVEIVTNGYYQPFESRNDPEYKSLMKEKQRLIKLNQKRWKKYNRHKELCFFTDAEIQKKKDIELDIIKRDSKGFDSESFKGMEYHGQKRKLKTND